MAVECKVHIQQEAGVVTYLAMEPIPEVSFSKLTLQEYDDLCDEIRIAIIASGMTPPRMHTMPLIGVVHGWLILAD